MTRSAKRQIAYAALLLVGAAFLCLPLSGCKGSSASAEDYQARKPSLVDDGMPPIRFRGDAGIPKVQFAKGLQVSSLCKIDLLTGQEVMACTFLAPDTMKPNRMVLPNPCQPQFRGERFAELACHELGHANGWPATHGG